MKLFSQSFAHRLENPFKLFLEGGASLHTHHVTYVQYEEVLVKIDCIPSKQSSGPKKAEFHPKIGSRRWNLQSRAQSALALSQSHSQLELMNSAELEKWF